MQRARCTNCATSSEFAFTAKYFPPFTIADKLGFVNKDSSFVSLYFIIELHNSLPSITTTGHPLSLHYIAELLNIQITHSSSFVHLSLSPSKTPTTLHFGLFPYFPAAILSAISAFNGASSPQ